VTIDESFVIKDNARSVQ